MLTKEEQRIRALIDQAVRPLHQRVDLLDREVRRLKNEVSNTKNAVNKITK